MKRSLKQREKIKTIHHLECQWQNKNTHSSVLFYRLQNTIKNAHGVLNSALNQAVIWGHIRYNPASKINLPKSCRKEMKTLTPDQAKIFMDAVVSSPHKTLFSLLLTSGMRPGEALALKWSDIDFDNNRVHIQRAIQRQGSSWCLKEPKTPQSRRQIPLPVTVMKDLDEHRIQQLETILKAKPGEYSNHDLVFASRTGEPLNHKKVYYNHFKPLLAQAGLPDIRLYSLRHTCATLLLIAGTNPKVVAERLGHASINLTLDTYSHVLPGIQETATATLENMLFGN